MRHCLFLTWALLLSLFGVSSQLRAQERPNIVVVLCDDLGYGDLACYGHPHIKTPHLDRMAAEGIRFTDCYSAAPVCSPSRVGLLTGRSPNRAGVYDWIPAAGKKRADARERVHMRKSEITIPALLKAAGYATCMTGKWHCNAAFNSAEQPQPGDFAFDHWFATQNNASPTHANPRNFVRNGKPVGPLEGYSCQLVVDEAIGWLEGHTAKSPEQPFFLFVAFHEPHEPVASPPELVAGYKDVAEQQKQAEYFANVENLDNATGRLLAALDRLGKDENTLVIFTSDNGPETLNRYGGASRSWGRPTPLRGMKLWTTDAGFRVAGIMRWPRGIKGGQTVSQPISALDFLPTFCRLAETQAPAQLSLDGTLFLPALTGQKIERPKPLFWCYYNAINERRVAMRDGDWKMLAKLSGGKLKKYSNVHGGNIAAVRAAQLTDFQLFHIPTDLAEKNDVTRLHPEDAIRLQASMESAYEEMARTAHYWE